jgi:tRNA synthetases class II core domain (F)
MLIPLLYPVLVYFPRGLTGIKQLRFKPAYNPYTEPSMEIFGYHPELGKWTEIGAYSSVLFCSLILSYLACSYSIAIEEFCHLIADCLLKRTAH